MHLSPIRTLLFVTAILTTNAAFADETPDFVIVTRTPEGPVVDPADNPHLSLKLSVEEQMEIAELLARYRKFGFGIEELVKIIAKNDAVSELNQATKDEISEVILAWAKPLPASNLEGNLSGYQALANLDPENPDHSKKRDTYAEKIKQQSLTILKKFKINKDEFSGITWYTHQDEPRYSDTRPFLSLYLGMKDGQKPILRFILNYTADSWLFVKNAQANIDGTIIDIPNAEWKRDNDSEIWEWIDIVATDAIIDLSRKISNSKKTIIRFNGQQYYDNYNVTEKDKQVLRDGLVAFEAMSN